MFKIQTKAILSVFMLVMALIVVGSVNAAIGDDIGITLEEVKINGDEVDDSETLRTQVNRDGELEVKVEIKTSNETYEDDVEISAFITGYEYNDDSDQRLSDTTEPFDVEPNTVYKKTLTLELPINVDKDEYKLRVLVSSRYSSLVINNYNLIIEPEKHNVAIKDVEFTPGTDIVAGRGLITQVRVKNYGDKDEEDIKVKVSIPKLGLSESDWIDEIESDDSETTEEIYLRIPGCADGEYQLNVEVEYDDGEGDDSQAYTINVEASEACEAITSVDEPTTAGSGNVVITVGAESQNIARGEGGAIYPITITNNGKTTRSFTLETEGVADWATSRVSPSNVVMVKSGETQSVYVYVAANENSAVGEKMFAVNVKSGSETVKQIPFKAQIVESAAGSDGLKKALQIGVVALVVILIIVGLVIGYNKMKESGEGEETSEEPVGDDVAQTYY